MGEYGEATRSEEGGAILILFASLIVLILSLVGMAIALSFTQIDTLRVQNVSNLAALSAMQELGKNAPDRPLRPYAERVREALDIANAVVADNGLYTGKLHPLFLAGDTPPTSSGGTLEFGLWVQERGSDCSVRGACCPNNIYPCFVPNPTPATSQPSDTYATAARVKLAANRTYPLLEPLLRLFGGNSVGRASTEGIAVTRERCTSIILDVSASAMADTHRFAGARLYEDRPGQNPRTVITFPKDLAYMAYDVNRINGLDCRRALNWTASNDYHVEQSWCNLKPSRSSAGSSTDLHFRSDYKEVQTLTGRMMLDHYTRVEPLSTWLGGVNAALRHIRERSAIGDRAQVLVVGSSIADRVPSVGFTKDLDYLVQLTNPDNIGKVDARGDWVRDPVHPNWVDRGWISVRDGRGGAGSNFAAAFDVAVRDIEQYCPANAQKAILFLSDGFATEYIDRSTGTKQSIYDYNNKNKDLYGDPARPRPNTYAFAENQILSPQVDLNDKRNNGFLADFLRLNIKVSTLAAGYIIRPNFINIWSSEPTAEFPSGHFLGIDEAIRKGYNGSSNPPLVDDSSFVPNTVPYADFPGSPCHGRLYATHECAIDYAGQDPAVLFGRPNYLMLELARRTGGKFCPLLKTLEEAQYIDHDNNPDTPKRLKDSLREHGSRLTISPEYMTSTSLAARCAIETLGQSPYSLAVEGRAP